MSKNSLILVLQKKQENSINDMAKVQIKSEKLTPFGGIFSIMEQFDALLSQTIDSTLGLRCKFYGYQYSEIFRSLMCVYFCGGKCIEDVSTHLMKHLSLHPRPRTCSADTILRAIEELTCKNTTYISDSGKSYDFNIADNIVGIENRDGNTNVRFYQKATLERIFNRLVNAGVHIYRARMDCGSCSEEIVSMVESHCKLFYIRANRCASLYDSMFALSGWKKEEINGIEFELNSILVEK